MVVVEDEGEPVGKGGYFVDQGGQDGLDPPWRVCVREPRGLEPAQCCGADGGIDPRGLPQGGDEIGKKTRRFVVARVEGEPGNVEGRTAMRPYLVGPFAEQGGLAKASRSGEEGE